MIAFVGHNLIQLFERIALPFLGICFLLAAISIFGDAHLSAPGKGGIPIVGAFLIEVAAAFGYTAGWNPYASDYTRYLRRGTGRQAGFFAGLGDFVSCTVLMAVGAASVTVIERGLAADASPTDAFTHSMPGWIKSLTLLAIALGAISANALNIYSGAMSALALGIKLSFTFRRGLVAIVAGVVGGAVAFHYVDDPSAYENWLLIIAYWIAPWLGVVFTDRYLRRSQPDEVKTALAEDEAYRNWAGPIAMLVGMAISIWLFSNQSNYVGLVPKANASFGDITPFVGFLVAGTVYAALFPVLARHGVASRTTDTQQESV